MYQKKTEIEKSCAHCRKAFKTGISRKIYCSMPCKTAVVNFRAKTKKRKQWVCVECGGECKKRRNFTCSDACKRARLRRQKSKLRPQNCGYCGKEFLGNNRTYCGEECREQATAITRARVKQDVEERRKKRDEDKAARKLAMKKPVIVAVIPPTKEEIGRQNLELAKQDVARAVARYGKQEQHRWLK